MSTQRPDTSGYTLERARAVLRDAGVEVAEEIRVGPSAERCEGERIFVIRQRERGAGAVELVVVGEWRSPEARIQ